MTQSTIHIERLSNQNWEWMYKIHCKSTVIADKLYAWYLDNCGNETDSVCWRGWQASYMIIAFNDLDLCTRFLYTWDEFDD